MDSAAQQARRTLGHELVRQLAPGELPLFAALATNQDQAPRPGRRSRGGDDLLGFGVGEAVQLLTPDVLDFVKTFWDAVADQAGGVVAGSVLATLKGLPQRLNGKRSERTESPPTLTPEQLRYVRDVAEQVASRTSLPQEQRGLLVDALVGVLSVPPTAST